MTVILDLLTFTIPLAVGFYLTKNLFQTRIGLPSFFYIVCLSIGVAIGFTSICFFGGLITTIAYRSKILYLLLESSACIVFGFSSFFIKPINQQTDKEKPHPRQLKYFSLIFGLVLISIFVLMVLVITNQCRRLPHGDWDAWAIWNLHARFIVRGQEFWTSYLTNLLSWSHPDYPLLLSGNVARLWMIQGNEFVATPIFLSILFAIGSVVALVSSLMLLRGILPAVLGGFLLLGTDFFLKSIPDQMADIPLAFYVLLTFTLIRMKSHPFMNTDLNNLLQGFFLACAAFTKNEGILILIVVMSCQVISEYCKNNAHWRRSITMFFRGMLPGLLCLMIFKLFLSPENDIFSKATFFKNIMNLLDGSRYSFILSYFFTHIFYFSYFSFPVLLAAVLISSKSIQTFEKAAVLNGFLSLSLILLGYFFTYVLTPKNLLWHLETSFDRLLLQLWPSVLFLSFSTINEPFQFGETANSYDIPLK